MKKTYRAAFLIIPAVVLIPLIIFGVRVMPAKIAIDREWRSGSTQNFKQETTSSLEIIPLYEKTSANSELIIGHGVSYLLRADSTTVLMDVGNNPEQMSLPPFVKNMETLGISAQEIDIIFISHPHPDHMGGTTAWKEKTVSFGEASNTLGNNPIVVPSVSLRNKSKGTSASILPIQLSSDVASIGVISYPAVFPLALFVPKGVEQALVVNVAEEGLVLITGCGHPGLRRLFSRRLNFCNRTTPN